MAADIRSNTDTGLLKIIACATMVVDHVGKMFYTGTQYYTPMRCVGRIAFPLFAYCMAVGCKYTRNIAVYALRLLLLAVLVHPLYMAAMGHVAIGQFDWQANFYRLDLIFKYYYVKKLNILFSLFLGVLLIWTIRDKKYVLTAPLIALCWFLDSRLDYGVKGILLMVIFYCFLDRPVTSFIWTGLLMVDWGMPYLLSSFSLSHTNQIFALLALPLIYAPIHTRLKLNKYFFYAFYPGHLLVIYLIQRLG